MVDTEVSLAAYACDKCRTRKVSCNRKRAGCQRCKDEDKACTYSRSGVIRRDRKRKHNDDTVLQQTSPPALTDPRASQHRPPATNDSSDQTHERLKRLAGKELSEHPSFKVLSSLFDAYGAIWQDQCAFDKLAEGAASKFFAFEDQAAGWTEAFVSALREGRPLTMSAPPDVSKQLAAGRPHHVQDRAWLVMFYSVVLKMVSATEPPNDDIKAKLTSNLWLAFNNVRLLLEPSDANLQAILILVCFAEDVLTPSLCWMLVTNACSMLQALGVSHWHLDPATRERRTMLFWQLNVIDKALALLSRRPPTLHRAMADEIAMPTLDQLLSSQPPRPGSEVPALFGAHHTHQMHLLSRLMADIWHLVYGRPGQERDLPAVLTTKDNLESWYRQAMEVLEAAALTEKPFLDTKSAASIDYGLKTMRFQFYFLSVLLTLPCKELRDHFTHVSQQMLSSLDDMLWDADEAEEPHPGLVWQLLFCPLTPFLALFGGILSKGKAELEQNREALEAMEHLPPFLHKLSARYPLAVKLEGIAVKFIQHTRSILERQDEANVEAPSPVDPTYPTPDTLHANGSGLAEDCSLPSTSLALEHFSLDSIDWTFWDQLMREPDSRLMSNPESVTGAGRLWYEQ
ncbi:hypothetical protein LTR36_010446 [Oleoguttula mirabilis]|uniref:Zn(2)-C6 fungal-type domain-containing protein n=1 Tax=Oleoguttula mirabilis TaxID=1507867 RepID=A0AAV9J4X2_9PEZI|nr:hypothetical protein LTR36_010446 [Oleoguttula mirabilis]